MSDPSIEPLIKKCIKRNKDYTNTHCYKDINEQLLLKLFDSQEKIKDE